MKIYLDYDNTLVDLTTPWRKWLYDNYRYKLTDLDIKTFSFIGDTYGGEANQFFKIHGNYDKELINPIPGSKSFIDTLFDMFGKENVFVISMCQDGTEEEKMKHSKKHFGINPENFINSFVKWKHTYNGILVDDNSESVTNHVENNRLPGIIFNKNMSYGWSNIDKNKPECKILTLSTSYSDVIKEVEKYLIK